MARELRYFVIYKPYGMLSQFTHEHGHAALGDLQKFPRDIYPVGRLDRDSEGLLLLTNDKELNHLLLNPAFAHDRTYWAQVECEISEEQLQQLESGVEIKVKGKVHRTLPAKAKAIPDPDLPERKPPVRFRENIPTNWLELTLREGKNRQVRKMTAAVGLPTLRLVRAAIEDLTLMNFQPGDVKEVSGNTIYRKLKIERS